MRTSALPLAHATVAALPSLPPYRRRASSAAGGFLRQCAVIRCSRLLPSVAARPRDPDQVTAEKGEDMNWRPSLLLQCGTLIASIASPAIAVTGSNNNFDDDLISMLIQSGILAIFYFLVVPPVLMNWMRVRWYKRKFLEMYLQFMLVFIFFPGLLLWAPFVNFRKFPRDPEMKYPWSTPSDLNINSQKLR